MGDKPLVLIPALNEQATIQEVVSSVIAQGFDVVVIDDGSGDLTSALARQAGATIQLCSAMLTANIPHHIFKNL